MTPPPSQATSPDGPLCIHCGYNLRGVRSPICAECGKPRARRITYFDRMEFDAVRAALDLAGVPYSYHDPAVGVVGMLTIVHGFNVRPVIMIEWSDLPAAEAALEDAGLSIPVVLVDHTHPFCPCCGFELPTGPTSADTCRCTVCGTACTWFEPSSEDETEADDASGARP